MHEGWVLIDTSAWVHALRPDGLPKFKQRVQNLLLEGRAAVCEIVILELLGGARTEREYRELQEDLAALEQFSITQVVWRQSYHLAHDLRAKGISIPPADQLIASVAMTYQCALLHHDKHYDQLSRQVPDLKCVAI